MGPGIQVARKRSAKALYMGANPILALLTGRGDGMVDIRDLKSLGDFPRVGSTPTRGTLIKTPGKPGFFV